MPHKFQLGDTVSVKPGHGFSALTGKVTARWRTKAKVNFGGGYVKVIPNEALEKLVLFTQNPSRSHRAGNKPKQVFIHEIKIGDKLPDMVNSPPHYNQGGVECIDAIEASVGHLNGFEAHCTGTAIKYLWRWKQKGGKQDLEKAIWYINKIIGKTNEPQ